MRRADISPKTVLIADDKPSGRELLRTVLEGCGCVVLEAADGTEALCEARRHHPDLMLLDLHMPGIDGFEVIRTLRGEPDFAATPIVALTASAMNGDREKAMEAGFTGYLTKPIRLVELRNEICMLLTED
jgi:two-component system cell cycle response regulator DivK